MVLADLVVAVVAVDLEIKEPVEAVEDRGEDRAAQVPIFPEIRVDMVVMEQDSEAQCLLCRFSPDG